MKNQGITPNAVTYGYYNRVRRLLSHLTWPSGLFRGGDKRKGKYSSFLSLVFFFPLLSRLYLRKACYSSYISQVLQYWPTENSVAFVVMAQHTVFSNSISKQPIRSHAGLCGASSGPAIDLPDSSFSLLYSVGCSGREVAIQHDQLAYVE